VRRGWLAVAGWCIVAAVTATAAGELWRPWNEDAPFAAEHGHQLLWQRVLLASSSALLLLTLLVAYAAITWSNRRAANLRLTSLGGS